jgi:hypothetical protein
VGGGGLDSVTMSMALSHIWTNLRDNIAEEQQAQGGDEHKEHVELKELLVAAHAIIVLGITIFLIQSLILWNCGILSKK